ncbi:hypothetical protein V5799_024484 [Amblyomma americanum]|uniref:Methylosome protein 50 n=1 Tax=Amblyomma americanum TaxID=6943 RepID=A0AAQ4ECD3_AMBAM
MLQLTPDEPRLLDTVFYHCDHDSGVTSLAPSPGGRWLASASWDMGIKLWDMTCMECSRTYTSAHSDVVWKVVFSTDPNVFLSCSKDGKVQSWDIRLSKPATVLGCCGLCGPTTLDWQPLSASCYVVGMVSGDVAVRDLRRPDRDVLELKASQRPLHRILFCPDTPSLLAICADDAVVRVADVTKAEDHIIYTSEEHTDFVRGLCWSGGEGSNGLLSSAWDGRVLQHSVGLSSEACHGDGKGPANKAALVA